MDKRFEKRLEKARNPRMRKRNGKRPEKFVRPGSHVGAMIGEILGGMTCGGGGSIYDPNPHVVARDMLDAAAAPVMALHHLAIAAGMDAADAVKRKLGEKERRTKTEKRRKYYAADAARRARQREAIRAATTPPANPCPTPAQLAEAFRRRRESEEWQRRFGDLMIDLEEHARRAFAFSGNRFASSSGGVKDWLKANCPLLAAHYSTCQRYKRLAQTELLSES